MIVDRGMYVPAGAILGSDAANVPVTLDHALVVLDLRSSGDGWILDYAPLRDVSAPAVRTVSSRVGPFLS